MATKSGILSTVNSFITAIITQAKLRSGFSTIVDNIYPTVVKDTEATTNIFTKTDTDFEYDINTTKIGRMVNIFGSITNVTGEALFNQKVATITNTEFRTEATIVNHYIPAMSTSGSLIFLYVRASSISIVGTIPSGVTFYFNGNYTVKD